MSVLRLCRVQDSRVIIHISRLQSEFCVKSAQRLDLLWILPAPFFPTGIQQLPHDPFACVFRRIEWFRAVYASPREGHIVLFVVPKSKQYDLGLGAKLTDLDVALSQQFQVIDAEVMQVPGNTPEELATFVNVDAGKQVYG